MNLLATAVFLTFAFTTTTTTTFASGAASAALDAALDAVSASVFTGASAFAGLVSAGGHFEKTQYFNYLYRRG